jgi:uncharacterized protein (DUF779 family)
VAETQAVNVFLTEAARAVLERVREQSTGELVMVIGNGCCDSTAPYLFTDYLPGPNERFVGEIDEVPVFLDESLSSSFSGTEVVVDARDDPQPDSFSCESELGCRFVLDRLPAAEGLQSGPGPACS